jgi:hypothetical protein
MAQTLTALPAVSSPPVIADTNTFRKNVSALANLNNQQLLALRILALAYQLNDLGGTDYRADFPLLIKSTANLFGNAFNVTASPYQESPMNRWEAVLDWNTGHTADATLSTNVLAIIVTTRALVKHPEATLYQVLMFLRYKISRF